MRDATPTDRIELSADTDPVVDVVTSGIGSVDVRTESGFVFRFQRRSHGYTFDDGYLPGENPDANSRNRGWVFEVDEVPEYVVDALHNAGYEYTGDSAHPRAMVPAMGDSEDDTWHDRAERHANAPIPGRGAPPVGSKWMRTDTGDTVTVTNHMFDELSPAMEATPFAVKDEDGNEVGFESAAEFYDQHEIAGNSSERQ